MFAHLYKYKFLWTIKNKNYILWTLTFPIILATLFYIGFGGLMNGNENKFNTINVALKVLIMITKIIQLNFLIFLIVTMKTTP